MIICEEMKKLRAELDTPYEVLSWVANDWRKEHE